MQRYKILFYSVFFLTLPFRAVHGDDPPPKEDRAPSREKITWTEAKTSYEFSTEYDYIGESSTDLGTGPQGNVSEHYSEIHHFFTRHCLRAFLLHGGMDWQRFGFNLPPTTSFVPNELDVLNLYLGIDFRWSRQDMLRVQSRPGFFSDFAGMDSGDFNAPIETAYTRIVSKRFQWALGLSINAWRRIRVLPGGGFRWYINDRWKLKFMLPEPRVEYRARENLHVFMGGDFRGESFRVAHNFGDLRGNSNFNNALVDYQEMRVGAGVSWNIKPLIELNLQSGYLVNRKFDFHNNGLTLHSQGAPYVNLNFQLLFRITKEKEVEGPEIERGRFEIPIFRQIFQ